MGTLQESFSEVMSWARQCALLESIDALLNWDERTMLPAQAGPYRAEQVSYVSNLLHAKRTDAKFGERLLELADSELAADPHSDSGATIRMLLREYRRQAKLPPRLVEELARTAVLGQQSWVNARQQNSFRAFQPQLDKMISLKREQAAAIGYADSPYDALLDEFEPGATTSAVADVLEHLRRELVPLVTEIAESGRSQPTELLQRYFPEAAQVAFGTTAAKAIGFDFTRGRLDVTHHPFCTTTGPHDCRITTRYDEHFFPSAFFSILHEAGHGLYEQGLRPDWRGMAPGNFASLGIHESQSRMWENLVGRSRPFWQYHFLLAQQAFPGALADVSPDDFLAAINDVRPSLIRVEADEATYNLHIVIRFELELALLTGDLTTNDLPAAWNDKYQSCIGITPPNDAQGVLQDVHWSAGLFGYFPTYTLGNLYAAQLFASAREALGTPEDDWARGDYSQLLDWLRREIHHRGQCHSAPELCRLATGSPLSHDALLRHLRGKLAPLYGLAE